MPPKSPLISDTWLALEWNDSLDPTQIYVTSKVLINWKCSAGHEFQSKPISRWSKNGKCRRCVRSTVPFEKSLASKFPAFVKEWSNKNKRSAETVAPNSCDKYWWACLKCKYEWLATPSNRTFNKSDCPKCNNKVISYEKSVAAAPYGSLWDFNKNGPAIEVFASSHKKYWWICSKGHEYQATPLNMKNYHKSKSDGKDGTIGCPICSNKQIVKGFNSLGDLFPELVPEYSENNTKNIYELAPHTNEKIDWKCLKGHVWTAIVSDRTRSIRSGCPLCCRTHSKLEKEFERILEVPKFNQLILGYRPDFKLNDHVYCNVDGLYWHTRRDPKYHSNLRKVFENKGLRLLQFYEDEVWNKPEIVRSIVNSVLSKNTNKVHGRDCYIHDVEHAKANEFLNKNHILGGLGLFSRHLGLFQGPDLLMLVSYRVGTDIELTRLCSLINHHVRGGATKLIKKLQELHPNLPIRTLIDHRYASVNNWIKWGFQVKSYRTGYQYTDNKVRVDKRRFRVPKGLNEESEAKAKGWKRLYDAGKTTLILSPI